jgi:hypothetical protein
MLFDRLQGVPYAVLRAFPTDSAVLSPVTLLVIFTIGVLFSVVAVTPPGLGMVELTLLGAFTMFGVSEPAAGDRRQGVTGEAMSSRVTGSEPVRQDTAPSRWGARTLAIGRIALGVYWLWEQHWKLPPDFGIHDARGLMFSFQSSIEHPTIGFYRTFLQEVVVPHFFLFGWLVFVSETLVGLSLTLGLFTRAGGALGTVQSINLLVAQGATEEGPWLYLGLIAANLAATLTPSNRQLSIDRVLAPKLRTRRGSSKPLVRLLLWMMGQ